MFLMGSVPDTAPSQQIHFCIFVQVLNTTAMPMGPHRTGWKCDVRLPPGIWIPLLGYPMENDRSEEGISLKSSMSFSQWTSHVDSRGKREVDVLGNEPELENCTTQDWRSPSSTAVCKH